MNTKMEVELVPFVVPEHVVQKGQIGLKQAGWKSPRLHKISDLEPEVLSQLCDDFRKGVFAKANQTDPHRTLKV